ncbi:FK506-binding protein 5-like [Watersipora subatra]|uniref:FK506-binding protein 5-like n=1 Tax=Watersipora subatra TaxID=2589382 RepID=UPI00355C2603
MNRMKPAVLLYCFLVMASAAPAALENNNDAGRDKRAGEVIFFENPQGEENSFEKRSEAWRQTEEPENDDGYKPFDEDISDEIKEEEVNELLTGLEKWAFDEAFNYLVDKLIAEAYEEELDSVYIPAETTPYAELDEQPKEMTTFKVPQMFDDEEDALAALIAKQNQPHVVPPYLQPPVEMSAEEDEPYNSLEVELDMHDEVEEEEGEEDHLIMEPEDTSSEDSSMEKEFKDMDGLDSFDIVNIMEYLDYLNKLKHSYSSGDAKMEKGEAGVETHGRKKRSLSTIDEWMGDASGEEGVCFTADEARELKSLLISLAKDRATLKELASYLSDDRSANPMLEGGYPVYERRYDFNPYDYGANK